MPTAALLRAQIEQSLPSAFAVYTRARVEQGQPGDAGKNRRVKQHKL